jgi:hypothetical protein
MQIFGGDARECHRKYLFWRDSFFEQPRNSALYCVGFTGTRARDDPNSVFSCGSDFVSDARLIQLVIPRHSTPLVLAAFGICCNPCSKNALGVTSEAKHSIQGSAEESPKRNGFELAST